MPKFTLKVNGALSSLKYLQSPQKTNLINIREQCSLSIKKLKQMASSCNTQWDYHMAKIILIYHIHLVASSLGTIHFASYMFDPLLPTEQFYSVLTRTGCAAGVIGLKCRLIGRTLTN